MQSDAARLEAFLARLYVDPDARAAFLGDRALAARAAGLNAAECSAVLAIDAVALELSARSFAHKRRHAERGRLTLRRISLAQRARSAFAHWLLRWWPRPRSGQSRSDC